MATTLIRATGARRADGVWHASVAVCVAGAVMGNVMVLAAATLVAGLAYAWRDYRSGDAAISAMTMYAASAAITFGGANLVTYLAEASRYRPMFYKYGAFDYIFTAQLLATAGTLVPLITYSFVRRVPWAGRGGILPLVGSSSRPRQAAGFAIGLLILSWSVRILGISTSALGSLGVFIDLGPAIAVFVLRMNREALRGGHGSRRFDALTLALAVSDFVWSLLFGFLRSEALWPIVAFVLPDVLHRRVRRRTFAVVAATLLAFVLAFQPLASLRRTTTPGVGRLAGLLAPEPADSSRVEGNELVVGGMAIVGRMATVNSLTQVARMTEEDGQRNGSTMTGVAFVFVPRIIWPNKPTITPGQWFAEQLGRGQRTARGFSNALNMTVPGEFYLNFGWLGVVLGLMLMAVLYAAVWDAVGHLRDGTNAVASALGLVLLTQAIFVGSAATAVVEVLLTYFGALAIGWAYRIVVNR